jgi:hypothetical protein
MQAGTTPETTPLTARRWGWIITEDHAEVGRSRVGVCGPKGLDPEVKRRLQAGEGKPFRTAFSEDYDDHPMDDRLVYCGLLLDLSDGGDGPEAMGLEDDWAPLRYAQRHAGATDLEFFSAGRWRSP